MYVSFVIPVVEFKPLLEATLASIGLLHGLDRDGYEIIIVQNGPQQTPPEWISKNSKVRCLYHAKKSIPVARNLGFASARYDFIAYLDEDSVCPPQWLDEVNFFFQSKNVGAYQSPSDDGNKVIRFEELYAKRDEFDGVIFFDTAGSCFRRDALVDVGGFDETFKRVEDLDIGTRLARRGWTIAFGTHPVCGQDRPSFAQKWRRNLESAYHSKRLLMKFDIPHSIKFFPSDFKLFAKKTSFEIMLERIILRFIRPSQVSPFDQKFQLKFMTVFLDESGHSQVIKNRFSILLTNDTVFFLIGWRFIISTDDQYLYELVIQSGKLITVDMSKMKDEKFISALAPYLLSTKATL